MISPLTSLRFLFALMVFGAHIYTIDPYFDHLFYKEGFVGVNFFFILSGFIIAYTYRDRLLEQKSTLREFWAARIARIYPLHLLTLGISVCVGGYISGDLIDWIKHFVANLFLLQPFIPAADYFFSFNSPSWSLGCEQLFYFLFPFIIGCLGKKNRILYLAGVLVIAIPIAMYFTMDQDIKAIWYVNPLTRLPDFLIGMLLFNSNRKNGLINRLRSTKQPLSCFSFFFICPRENIYPKYFVIPVITGCLSVCCCMFLHIRKDIYHVFYPINILLLEVKSVSVFT